MSDCRNLEPMLAPYVDGVAEPQARATVESHLEQCPECRDHVASERVVREVLVARRQALRGCASDHLRRRCEAQRTLAAPPDAPVGSGFFRRTLVPLSIAASLLVVAGAVLFFTLNRGVEVLAAQLAVDHIKCHQLYSGQAATPDPLLISKAWQNERGWALEIPPSAAAYDLQLLEVRRCGTTEGLNAHILYKWHGNPLSLYVMNRESKRASSEAQFVTKAGQDAVIWTDGGRTYAVVGEASPRELNKIVDYVKLTARSRW
jgi:anti-sigma factor RsiW